jgi:hypothetical protein
MRVYVRRHGRLCGGGSADLAHTDPAHWWIGAELVCQACGCHFTLEEGDTYGVNLEDGFWGQGAWPCPECEDITVLDEWEPNQPPPNSAPLTDV